MANFLTAYGTSNQAITCTFASLTNTSSRQSTAVDNTTNKFLDALLFLKIGSPSTATSATGYLSVYAYGTVDGGTTYTEGASGSDAAITLTSPTNLKLIGYINVVANSTTYYGGPFSVAKAFDGVLPDHWGIVIQNNTGGTLSASNCSAYYQGILNTYA